MNTLLLKSSILSLFIHYIFLQNIPIVYLIGLITSIINHGFTSNIAVKIDRYYMRFCFLHNLLYIMLFGFLFELSIMLSATILYFLNSKFNNSICHMIAHVLISCCNIRIAISIM